MKFNVIASALVALGFSSSSVLAADPITVYGKANVTVQSTDDGNGSFTEVKSNASRLGAKGEFELDNGLTAFYTVEWQVDLADESGSDNFKARNQFVGLKGDFGKVFVGRSDTAFKVAQGKFDLFNDLEADIKVLFKGENRMGDSVNYTTPSFNNFTVSASYIAADSEDGDSATSIALNYGDAKLKKTGIYGSVAIDSEVKGYDAVRATLYGKFGDFRVGAMVHQQEEVATGSDKDGWAANLAYKLNNVTFKAQYQTLEDDSGMSLGADYKLGKNTKAFVFYTDLDKSGVDKSYTALGLEHKF